MNVIRYPYANLKLMRSKSSVVLPLFLAFLLLLSIGCGRGGKREKDLHHPVASEQQYSFLLITIDTWRWDYIGASGMGKVATPTLDRLAHDGIYGKEIITPCPLTTPAHATILTGLTPLKHGVYDCVSYALGKDHVTLAELFREKGYATAAFVSAQPLSHQYGLNRGFDLYDDSGLTLRSEKDWLAGSRDGQETTRKVLEVWNGYDSGKPLFLWVHYYDAHMPYRPRPEFDKLYPDDPYAAQVAFIDSQVKVLVERVKRDPGRKWLLVIVGDHGEGQGDFGELHHGMGIYPPTTHVPFILYPRPIKKVRLQSPWGLIDIAPTVADLCDLPSQTGWDGLSIFSRHDGMRTLLTFTILPTLVYGVFPNLGIERGSLLYIKQSEEELYDLAKDRNLRHNHIHDESYRSILREMRKKERETYHLRNIFLQPNMKMDEESIQKLKNLGYLEGKIPEEKRFQHADMREVLADHSRMEEVNEKAFRSDNPRLCLPVYEELIRKYPKAIVIIKNYARMLLNLGEFNKSMHAYDRALALNPRDPEMLEIAGSLHLKFKDFERAKRMLEKSLEIEPERLLAKKRLGILYLVYEKDPVRAAQLFKAYLQKVPNDPEAQRMQSVVLEEERRRDGS